MENGGSESESWKEEFWQECVVSDHRKSSSVLSKDLAEGGLRFSASAQLFRGQDFRARQSALLE